MLDRNTIFCRVKRMSHGLATRQHINATEDDLKQNRLGVMSQGQVGALQQHIDAYQARMSDVMKRAIFTGVVITSAIMILVFVRVLPLPIAILIELAVVGGMVYLTSDFNRFVQQLLLDHESHAVRIVKGRVSRHTMRTHPLYKTLRVELQNYRLLDETLSEQFGTGELYQLYVLPQSRVIIAAEKTGEKGMGYFH